MLKLEFRLYNKSWKHQIYKQIKKGEIRKQKRKERLIVIPSIRIPMRRDSVPVVGYLSFLASSSPIANALIALLDHLLHSQFTHYNFSIPTTPKQKQNKNLNFLRKIQLNSLGNFHSGGRSSLWLSAKSKTNYLKFPIPKWEIYIHIFFRD